MAPASPISRWGALTNAERRIVCWVVGLIALGLVARTIFHETEPPIPDAEKIDGSAGTPGPTPL